MAKRIRGTVDRTAIALMFGALTLLFIFLTGLVPDGFKLLFIFIAGLMVSAVMAEEEVQKAMILYIVCSILGMIISSGFSIMAPYILFCGWYPIVKFILDNAKDRFLAWCIKFMLFNLAFGLCVLWAPAPMLQPLMEKFPIYIMVPLLQLMLIVYDAAIWFFAMTYTAVIRRFL